MKVSIWLVAALLVGGCSFKKTADDIRDYSEQLKNNSEVLKQESHHLGQRMDDTEAELTFKDSAAMMLQNLEWLFGEQQVASSPQPNPEPDLLLYAGVVVKAMWFQFWKGDYREDLTALDQRFEVGAEILFTRAKTHIPFSRPVDLGHSLIGIPNSPNRDYEAIASLGAKLDFVRPEYASAAGKAGLEGVSFYDIVVLALKNRGELVRREKFPVAVTKILQYQQEAEYMLQLRHNYLPMMVVASITDFKDLGEIGRGKQLLTGAVADLGLYNAEQLKEWTRWLKAARQTREELRRMGIEPQYNGVFAQMVSGVNFGQADLLAMSEAQAVGINKLRREFAQAYVEAANEAMGVDVTRMPLRGDSGQPPAFALMAAE